MYNNKLAVALKSNGKVLREFGEIVYIPFGSEYSILIKNMNSHRALVTVTVDGKDVGDGQFVVNANDSLDIERFIKNGNLAEGNRLKYIERTENIEKHRGVGIEDGLVRVEFQFEKPQPRGYELIDWRDYHYGGYRSPSIMTDLDLLKGSLRNIGSADVTFTATNAVGDGDAHINFSSTVNGALQSNDAGITVAGSVSDQAFTTVSSFPVEDEKHVIVLQMLGETEDNKKVVQPVTVKAKPKCSTCGRTNKATAKFCTECGTSLTII